LRTRSLFACEWCGRGDDQAVGIACDFRLGVVIFPVMAAVSSCRGQHADAKRYFHAWQFSVLTVLACFGFIMVTGFVTPPKVLIGLMSTSIAFHVYRTERALR
jgi:hypothetical protein